MAGVKISNLPAIPPPPLEFADVFPLVQSGVTYKTTLDSLYNLYNGPNAVRLGTTANLNATYNNGTGGVGATLTNAGALAALSIDGVATVVGDEILVKNQSSTFQNGIYTVTIVGDGATAWVLTRAIFYDLPADIAPGDFVTVVEGTVNAKTQWIQLSTVATIGTDPITFESNVVAGTGITKTNNVLSTTAIPAVSPSATLVSTAGSVAAWTAAMTDGQTVFGVTGGTPVPGTIAAGFGIAVTPAAGGLTISATGGGFTWNAVAGTTQALAAGNGYINLNGALTTFTLPASSTRGDTFQIGGFGAGGWTVAQNAGQSIHIVNATTTPGVGGSLSSTGAEIYSSVEFLCVVDTAGAEEYLAIDFTGNLTIV